MKYLRVAPVPSPIESWLHTQLEARGVDKVYSRYILSLFHSNDFDQDIDLDFPSKELKRLSGKNKYSRNSNIEKLIRTSVIDCLTSVSEYKVGIESLVDELQTRIKNEKNSSTESNDTGEEQNQVKVLQTESNDFDDSSCLDLVQKYYDAFPPLGGKHCATILLSSSKNSSPWNGKNKKLLSGSKKLKSKLENKENLEEKLADIASVQSFNEITSNPSAVDLDAMDKSVKRKLFVEVDEPKDSLAYLMERVEGTKDIWSDSESQSQLSTPSCASSYVPPYGTTSIWSDVDLERKWSSAENENCSFITDSGVGLSMLLLSPMSSASSQSIGLLNHCPERSVFRPVTPGSKRVFGTEPPLGSTSITTRHPPPTASDENLLTSTKTHFCPIDKEPYYKTVNDKVSHEDGTTFTIASELDHVDYEIAEDGTFRLESCTYMEFKANGLNNECYNLFDPFKPKFKVFSDKEKGCQTEDPPHDQQSVTQQSPMQKSSSNSYSDDFFFPGEERIARDIMKSLDDDDSFYMEEEPSKKNVKSLHLDSWETIKDDGWPTPNHDYQDIRCNQKTDDHLELNGLYTNYSIWAPSIWGAPPPFPLDTNANLILCSTKSETPIPLGITMGNLKISSDRKRRHSSSQYYGNIMLPPFIKSDAGFFQQSITL